MVSVKEEHYSGNKVSHDCEQKQLGVINRLPEGFAGVTSKGVAHKGHVYHQKHDCLTLASQSNIAFGYSDHPS